PARFAVALGSNGTIPDERRRAILERAVVGRPTDLTILMALAYTFPINQAEGAGDRLRWLQAAVAAQPRNAAAHNSLGVALRDKGQWEAAIAEYKRAAQLDPKYALAHHNLGVALADKSQWDDAIAESTEAIQLDAKLAPAHTNLGLALYGKGQLDKAIAEYNE